MLCLYLKENDCTRLCDTIRRRKDISKRIVWCFYGTGANGKSTVSNHLATLMDDIKVCHEITHINKFHKVNYLIVEINDLKDTEIVKTFCEKHSSMYDFYHFEKTFFSNKDKE